MECARARGGLLGIAIGVSLAIGVVVVPVRKASKLRPIEALRYE